MVTPLTRMQATPAIDMREKRAPTRRQAWPLWMRPSASRKQGMPPIQIAAPNWCRPSTSRSGVRLSSRAAACVVRVAAASSITVSTSSGATGARWPRANRVSAISAAAAVFTMPATAKCAPSTSPSDRSTVPINTALCSPTVANSQTSSATALQAASRAQLRPMLSPAEPS